MSKRTEREWSGRLSGSDAEAVARYRADLRERVLEEIDGLSEITTEETRRYRLELVIEQTASQPLHYELKVKISE